MAIADYLVLVDGHVEKHGTGLHLGDERGQASRGVMRVDERRDEGRIIDRPIGIPPGFQGDLIHGSGIIGREGSVGEVLHERSSILLCVFGTERYRSPAGGAE
jgi:hypothetical protein